MIQRALILGAIVAVLTASVCGEELFVPADGSIVTSAPLIAGQNYIVEARGTYGYRDVVPEKIADAEWVYSILDEVWIETPGGGDLDLHVNGADISMMGTEDGESFQPHVFSPDHVYRAGVFGRGLPVELSIYDERHDDNVGGLEVTIRPAAMGDTNLDDVVDERDYANLAAQFGDIPAAQSADFNGDGTVDLHDFAIQRANTGPGPAEAPTGERGAIIPEPASLALVVVCLPVLLRRKDRRVAV